ncbi:helix-turn-helix domain-containing protein [Sphaerotilus mobilis]|uniref:Regulatory Fis family protein n=1 Tax=Sphaerotilus mobilis TaxID=47994 RepID=A0A4Q7LRH1_9BURK|nr:helix-turn-helix domain-containing protein [Sphaerotilus mobilis]RZS56943.1 regulatory Fis family protein [Sphaerotilus mobilis]
MTPGANLPANPFYASAEQRIALARQRFFEDGVRPSGMVSEAVIQSWARCLRAEPDHRRAAVFEPVTPSRVHSTLRQNQQLLAAAAEEMERLKLTLAGTSSTAMLTDAQGVIVGSTFTQARSHERLMPITTRVGVNLSEEAVGTTAPGLTARTAQASVVSGAEHYFGNAQLMHCAAAPIHDIRGRLAGVLDLSSEGVPFAFDAATVVGHYAAEIENRLLCAQSTEHLVVRMQIVPSLLDTPMAGLAGITGDGRIDWLNGAAARLLGMAGGTARPAAAQVEDHVGVPLDTLIAWSSGPAPQPLALPNGLMLWVRCDWHSRDGHRPLHAVAAPAISATPPVPAPAEAPAPLRETEHQTIVRAVAECAGNVSQAARLLGISRGRVYRHLQADAAAAHRPDQPPETA